MNNCNKNKSIKNIVTSFLILTIVFLILPKQVFSQNKGHKKGNSTKSYSAS